MQFKRTQDSTCNIFKRLSRADTESVLKSILYGLYPRPKIGEKNPILNFIQFDALDKVVACLSVCVSVAKMKTLKLREQTQSNPLSSS